MFEGAEPFSSPLVIGVLLLAVLLLVVWWCRSPSGRNNRPSRKTGDAPSGGVVLMGPSGGGKTALLHALLHGVVPPTLPSTTECSGRGVLVGAPPGSAPVALLDAPGHAALLPAAVAAGSAASAVVFVVDASGGAPYLTQAAALLYDLFTNPAFVAKAPRLLLLAHKADLPGALTPTLLRDRLAEGLERLRASRPSIGVEGGGRGGDLDASPLLRLGTVGVAFTFADAPCVVTTGASSLSVGEGGLAVDAVTAFILDKGN